MNKRTKIVCTIGPASEKKPVLEAMVKAGMNVARLNFSHGSYKNHQMLINNIRSVSKKLGQSIAILQDLQGPRIRIGELPKSGVELNVGEDIVLVPEAKGQKFLASFSIKALPVQYDLAKEIKRKARILMYDGLIELKVKKVQRKKSLVWCRVVKSGAVLLSHRGINILKAKISAPAITDHDKEDLRFGLKAGVGWVALSFVKEAGDVVNLKKLIKRYQPKSKIKVIAKIERQEAVDNFDEILKVADGIMVARGDLGIELPPSSVPVIQKEIVNKCLRAAKPVIVATQMMESMMEKPRPTRAEVSDVANAVADHTDAVMLSGETATGKYPVEVVKIMANTIIKMERSPYDDLILPAGAKYGSLNLAMADCLKRLVKEKKVKAIVGLTKNGEVAEMISRFRPEVKMLFITDSPVLVQQLALVWGVEARLGKLPQNLNGLIKEAKELVTKEKICQTGDKIVVANTCLKNNKENVDLVQVVDI